MHFFCIEFEAVSRGRLFDWGKHVSQAQIRKSMGNRICFAFAQIVSEVDLNKCASKPRTICLRRAARPEEQREHVEWLLSCHRRSHRCRHEQPALVLRAVKKVVDNLEPQVRGLGQY